MRARIVKHSVDSAMLHEWVVVYSAEVREGNCTVWDELMYKEKKHLFVQMRDDEMKHDKITLSKLLFSYII